MADSEGDDGPDDADERTVVVPVDLYKRVTIFSTLFATLFVVLGFMLFDAATFDASVVRLAVVGVLSWVGLAPADSALDVTFAVLGFLFVGLGAGVYVVGARFRAPGMGKPKDESDQESNDG